MFSGMKLVPTSLHQLLRSLQHYEFRLYFSAQAVSVIGTWMQNVGQAWLVYRLTGSSLMLGLTSFAGLFPILLGGLYGGVLADRVSRHRLAVMSHRVAMLQAFALGLLTLFNLVEVWHVILFAAILGTSQAVGMPARHAFISELVPRQDLTNAIALHSTAFNAARFIGPAVAGWVVYAANEGVVFILNGLTYVFFLLVLRKIAPRKASNESSDRSVSDWIKQGAVYAWQNTHVRAALLMVGMAGLVGTPYTVLMPVIADKSFHGGPPTLGLLLGASGAGSLLGALVLAHRSSTQGLDSVIGITGLLAGVGLMLFANTQALWLALPILALIGFCMTTLVASSNTLIQLVVPDNLRGRVISLFSMAFVGASPLGNLLAGALAESITVASTILGYGAVCAMLSTLYLLRVPKAAGL